MTTKMEVTEMETRYKYEMVCVFDGFRIDHQTVYANNDKEAKQRTRMCYIKKCRHLVTGVRVSSMSKV